MQAAHWFESFRRWRWAPFVALVAGALAFIAIALLLIPIRLDEPARIATVQTPPALVASESRTIEAAAVPAHPPALRVAPTAVEAPSRASDNSAPSALLVAQPSPEAKEEAPLSAANPPDFGANIVDRGDRPAAPTPRPRVH